MAAWKPTQIEAVRDEANRDEAMSDMRMRAGVNRDVRMRAPRVAARRAATAGVRGPLPMVWQWMTTEHSSVAAEHENGSNTERCATQRVGRYERIRNRGHSASGQACAHALFDVVVVAAAVVVEATAAAGGTRAAPSARTRRPLRLRPMDRGRE